MYTNMYSQEFDTNILEVDPYIFIKDDGEVEYEFENEDEMENEDEFDNFIPNNIIDFINSINGRNYEKYYEMYYNYCDKAGYYIELYEKTSI